MKNRRAAQRPAPPVAHERAIIESWTEDEGVYVTLPERITREQRVITAARAAAGEAED